MILWTMQPEEVYQQIMQNGVYICDPARMNMPEFTEMYDFFPFSNAFRCDIIIL